MKVVRKNIKAMFNHINWPCNIVAGNWQAITHRFYHDDAKRIATGREGENVVLAINICQRFADLIT